MSTATNAVELTRGRVRFSIVAILFAVTMVNYAVGFIIQATGSFNGALVFIGANALVAIVSYLFVVGEIKRFELKMPQGA